MEWAWTWSGIVGIVAGLVGTVVVAGLIFWLQQKDQKALNRLVTRIDDTVVEVAEMLARRDDQQIVDDIADAAEDGDPEPNRADGNRPANEDAYVRALRGRGVTLSDNPRWMKKVRDGGDGRGNLGWFVDVGDGRRYFIHHGRKTMVRQAIPRELLDAWKKETGRDSTEIELDYQTGSGRGNHAWFIRTYDGNRWKIARGKGSIVVTQLDGDTA